jgi:hypothetical protein
MTWLEILGAVASIFAILGVPVGIWMAQWELNYRIATGHLGPLCTDEDKMGYFVAKLCCKWFYRLRPVRIPKVPPPRLPTITALIEAGDEGWFTSAIFNSISPNHAEVSWKPLYEAFFCEYIWSCYRWGLRQNSNIPQNLCTYIKKAKKTVQLLNSASKTAYYGRTVSQYNCTAHLDVKPGTNALGQCQSDDIDPHFLFEEPVSSRRPLAVATFTQVNRAEALGSLAVATFTEVYRAEALGSDAQDEDHRPILVRSHRSLSGRNLRVAAAKRQAWWNKTKDIWIHAGHPSLEISKEELVAMSFIIGIQLNIHNSEFLPNGYGPYGMTITSDKVNRVSTFSIMHGHRVKKPALGSGYSTLYAKHMACGCLPFAQRDTESGPQTDTIPITDAIIEHLKKGGSLSDQNPDERLSASSILLCRLPGSTDTNFFQKRIPDGQSIFKADTINNINQAVYAYWWDAVAGIAFGGLAPMATRNLKEIVQFTLRGNINWTEFPKGSFALEKLVSILDLNLSHTTGMTVLSPSISPQDTDVVFVRDPEVEGTRFTVEILNRYSTLVERLMAIAQMNLGVDSAGIVELVHSTLSDMLKTSYKNAVRRARGEQVLDPVWDIDAFLKDLGDRAGTGWAIEGPTLVQDCAKVALCTIAAWTDLAITVNWEDHEANLYSQKAPPANRKSNEYYPPLWRHLPDVSAWS